ncbi:5-methylcytosine restriction system specificity protein McrC [Bacillus timonensis]
MEGKVHRCPKCNQRTSKVHDYRVQKIQLFNYQRDFESIKMDRSMIEYKLILKCCKLFLLNESFTIFVGKLFPKEKVFEAAYIATYIKKGIRFYL